MISRISLGSTLFLCLQAVTGLGNLLPEGLNKDPPQNPAVTPSTSGQLRKHPFWQWLYEHITSGHLGWKSLLENFFQFSGVYDFICNQKLIMKQNKMKRFKKLPVELPRAQLVRADLTIIPNQGGSPIRKHRLRWFLIGSKKITWEQ